VLDAIAIEPEDDQDDVVEEIPLLTQPIARKAGHRQPRVVDDTSPSWWVTAKPDGFTRIGEQETAKTAHTRAGSSVAFRILQE
jgi:hypothetical protein